MKDDTISRASALDFVSAMNFCGEISDEAYQKLTVHFENLPSAQPGWIPFGVPMNSGQHYLVTLRQKFEGEETYRVRIMRLHEGHWLYPHHFPEWINDEMEQEVVAWMPLPTPYREGGQDNGAD